MSSSNFPPNVSPSQFQGLFDVALNEYNQKTGKDITTHPLTERLQNCDSSDKVLCILREQAQAFNRYRKGDGNIQLMRRLKPTVDILLGLSTSGAFGEGIGLVRLIKSTYYHLRNFITHLVENSTSESDICRCWSLTRSMCYPFGCFPGSIILTFKLKGCQRSYHQL